MLEQPVRSGQLLSREHTVVVKEQLKGQFLDGLGSGEEATETGDASIGLQLDVNSFGQFFLSRSQYRAEDDGKEFGGQHAALLHTIFNREGVWEVAAMFNLTLWAFVELLSDGEELWWVS